MKTLENDDVEGGWVEDKEMRWGGWVEDKEMEWEEMKKWMKKLELYVDINFLLWGMHKGISVEELQAEG